MNPSDDFSAETVTRSEHIDPKTTGDNIQAKRVANYVWDGVSAWVRQTGVGGGSTTNSGSTIDAAPATQDITARDIVSATATGANGQSFVTGVPTAGSAASFTLAGYDTVRVMVSGTWTGTLVQEYSFDSGTTWVSQGLHQTGTAYTASTFIANFAGQSNASGFTNYRIRSTAAWTGTATVKIINSVNPASVYIANNLKFVDATVPTIGATVKAASTAAIATDTALVVAPSPNTPTITDGTNVANILKSDGTAAGQNSQMVSGATQTLAYSQATTTPTTALNTAGYTYVAVDIQTVLSGGGTQFQVSNDNTNWRLIQLTKQDFSDLSATPGNTSSMYSGNLAGAKFFRLNFTGSGGTAAGTIVVSTLPQNPQALWAFQKGTWTVGSNSATGSAVPANAFYIAGISGANLSGINAGGPADAVSQVSALQTEAFGYEYNGATSDRKRNNTTGAIIAAGATSTQTNISLTTYNARSLVVILNVSAITAGTATVTIDALTSSNYVYNLLTGIAVSGTGTTPYRIFPGAAVSANTTQNDVVPRTVRVTVTVTGTVTYGVDYVLGV